MSLTKEEIIKGHYACTCDKIYTSRNMVDPSCVLHEHGGEIELIMNEYAQQEMEKMLEWYNKLSPAEKCTVWPPLGSGAGTGLYNMPMKDIVEKYLNRNKL